MSDRANALADRLDAVNRELIALVEGASEEGWAARCAGEQCTVAALAYHVGGSHAGVLDALVRPIAEGGELRPVSWEQIHRWNAENARTNAQGSRDGALALLRDQGDRASAYLRSLDDGQLERTATIPMSPQPMTAEAVIEHVLIGHAAGHLESMRAATASTIP